MSDSCREVRGSLFGWLGHFRMPVVKTQAACNAAPDRSRRSFSSMVFSMCGGTRMGHRLRAILAVAFQGSHQRIRNQVAQTRPFQFLQVLLPCGGACQRAVFPLLFRDALIARKAAPIRFPQIHASGDRLKRLLRRHGPGPPGFQGGARQFGGRGRSGFSSRS